MGDFTFDEMNLMCIYNTGSRTGLIDALTEMRGELSPEETELRELNERRRVCRAGAVPGFRRVKTTPRPSGAA